MFHVNFFKGEPPLVEDAPQGDASVELRLDARAAATLSAALALGSFELSHLLGQVYLAGARDGERAVRGRAP